MDMTDSNILSIAASVIGGSGLMYLGVKGALGVIIHGFDPHSMRMKVGAGGNKKASEYTLYHEIGHVLLNAAFKNIDSAVMVCAFGKQDRNGNLGYAIMQNTGDMLHTKGLCQWEMLACLSGYMSERFFFGQETMGSGEDREDWMKSAKLYLENGFCDGVYYNKPSNDFEFKNNDAHIKALMVSQEELLERFFAMNTDVVKDAVSKLAEEGVLSRSMLEEFFERVQFPDDFPIPVIEMMAQTEETEKAA